MLCKALNKCISLVLEQLVMKSSEKFRGERKPVFGETTDNSKMCQEVLTTCCYSVRVYKAKIMILDQYHNLETSNYSRQVKYNIKMQ